MEWYMGRKTGAWERGEGSVVWTRDLTSTFFDWKDTILLPFMSYITPTFIKLSFPLNTLISFVPHLIKNVFLLPPPRLCCVSQPLPSHPVTQNRALFISTPLPRLLTSCKRWMCSLQVSKSLSPETTISPRGMAADTEEQDNYPTALWYLLTQSVLRTRWTPLVLILVIELNWRRPGTPHESN